MASGPLAQTMVCAVKSCDGTCAPIGCVWGDWTDWGACDRCGGEMRRVRRVLQHSKCGGQACSPSAAEAVSKCPRLCHQPTYCAFGEWEPWGICSSTCGSGVQVRARSLHLAPEPEVVQGLPETDIPLKSERLLTETETLEMRAWQEMAVAFACGLLALTSCVGLRAARKR